MALSGVGATPQPEQNKYDLKKEREEQNAASIFQSLNKNGDEQIDEKDGLDNAMLNALKKFVGSSLTLDNFKKVAGKLYDFTYTKQAKYNGRDAQVTYNILGQIRSVNTGAQNVNEAREHMGLNKTHIVKVSNGSGFKDMPTYGREYKKGKGTEKEYFVWNPKTKSMDFEWGAWVNDSYNADNNVKKTSNNTKKQGGKFIAYEKQTHPNGDYSLYAKDKNGNIIGDHYKNGKFSHSTPYKEDGYGIVAGKDTEIFKWDY